MQAVKKKQNEPKKADILQLIKLIAKTKEPEATGADLAAMNVALEANAKEIQDMNFLAGSVEKALLRKIAGCLTGFEKFYEVEVRGMRERLGYEQATEIERILLDRIVMCYLRVIQAEDYQSSTLDDGFLRQLEASDRLLLRAHTRLLRAVDAYVRIKVILSGERTSGAHVLQMVGGRNVSTQTTGN